jgi:lipoprotein-releasing system permease protein
MDYPLLLALRYLRSKKRAFISVGTAFAMIGVMLGVAALATVMSVTGGFQQQFREKVLGVNAHVLVLKYSIDFREYRDVMKEMQKVPHVIGVAPFVINPMMVTHGDRTATGVLLKGVDPELMPKVLDLPKHITAGSLTGLRRADSKPPDRPRYSDPWKTQPLVPSAGDDGGAPKYEEPGQATDSGSSNGGSLLDIIQKQIQDDDARAAKKAAMDAGAGALPSRNDVAQHDLHGNDVGSGPSDAGPGLMGAVTPDGGYASTLPEDDVLPDAIDPDPCKDPAQVAALPGVVIGRTLGKQLNVGLGDCLQITSPTIGITFGGQSARPPIAKQFRVIAIFEAGFDQYDSKLVYTDLYEAQAFYEQGDSVTGVEMKIDDIDRSGEVAKDIDKRLSNGVYHTMDWRELNHGLFTALLIQQIGMSVVLALIIVVAAFTVVATLIMVVLDKKKEISLLKALGAKDDDILRVFLYQGGMIGLIGTTFGLALGYGCCEGLLAYGFPLDPKVYFISRLPVNIRPTEFLITGAVAIVICLLATIFPALYAAWLRPSDGLRAD